MSENKIRSEIVAAYQSLEKDGLNRASTGNISVRTDNQMLITPSAIAAEKMMPESIVKMNLDDDTGAWNGNYRPSSEWRFHRDLLRMRSDIHAVVHTHAPFSTILANARKSIPAVHYMIAAFGGQDIRVADYARYGTSALSKAIVRAMEGRYGCLMANHGMLAGGENLTRTMWLTNELEALAHQYYHLLTIGGGYILNADQIEETAKGFETYGVQAEKNND